MNNRTLFALLLAMVLVVPVFAQDNSTAQTQPATSQSSSSQSSSSQPAAQTATGKEPLQPETREGFWGHLNPFARKKYVARQTQPIRDRINELDELT
ncbi:MAG: flagellar motor protein MotB, partial [Terriglobales bacterium]